MTMDGVYTGARRLSTLDASGRFAGDLEYVLSIGAAYRLSDIPGPAGALTSVPASNLTGFYWVRQPIPNPIWWPQPTWNIDPVGGDDEDPLTLKSFDELGRRLYRARLDAPKIFNVLDDVPDADTLTLDADSPYTIQHTFAGQETVAATITVTGATPSDPATNQPNLITVTGFDFAVYEGHAYRVQGTQRYGAILLDEGGGSAKLGQTYNSATGTVADIVAGDVLEIVTRTKGPLAIEIRGAAALNLRINMLDFHGAGNFIARVASLASALFFTRCEFHPAGFGTFDCPARIKQSVLGATPFDLKPYGGSFILEGSSFIGSSLTLDLTGNTQGAGLTSCSAQNASWSVGEDSLLILKANYLACGLGAGRAGLNLGGARSCAVIHGAYYGDGNNATSIGVVQADGTRVYYTATRPTIDTGVAIHRRTGDFPWSALPLTLDPVTDAAFLGP